MRLLYPLLPPILPLRLRNAAEMAGSHFVAHNPRSLASALSSPSHGASPAPCLGSVPQAASRLAPRSVSQPMLPRKGGKEKATTPRGIMARLTPQLRVPAPPSRSAAPAASSGADKPQPSLTSARALRCLPPHLPCRLRRHSRATAASLRCLLPYHSKPRRKPRRFFPWAPQAAFGVLLREDETTSNQADCLPSCAYLCPKRSDEHWASVSCLNKPAVLVEMQLVVVSYNDDA